MTIQDIEDARTQMDVDTQVREETRAGRFDEDAPALWINCLLDDCVVRPDDKAQFKTVCDWPVGWLIF